MVVTEDADCSWWMVIVDNDGRQLLVKIDEISNELHVIFVEFFYLNDI